MAVKINVRVDLNGTTSQLNRLLKEVENLDVPFRKSGVYLERSIGKRFRAGGGSHGMWKPISPATILRHPHRAGGKVLNDTGQLKKSVTTGATKRITGKRMYFSMGSAVKYAAAHNFGHKQIPQREFFYVDAADERAIKKIFEKHIEGLINNG
jgi:phage gpG-like protein